MDHETLLLTKNRCYISGKKIKPKGIVVHCTGANNPNLKRYVGPDDGKLGVNTNNNHWNSPDGSKCVHAFIGYDKNGTVRCYQTLPWDYRPWGCGAGKKGSYNDSHIQFEICEDDMTNKQYFKDSFGMAIELCVYLSKKFDIRLDKIVSHKESHKLGYASDHGDPEHWMTKFDWTMDTFRNKVKQSM